MDLGVNCYDRPTYYRETATYRHKKFAGGEPLCCKFYSFMSKRMKEFHLYLRPRKRQNWEPWF